MHVSLWPKQIDVCMKKINVRSNETRHYITLADIASCLFHDYQVITEFNLQCLDVKLLHGSLPFINSGNLFIIKHHFV